MLPQRGFATPTLLIVIVAASLLGGGIFAIAGQPEKIVDKTKTFLKTPIFKSDRDSKQTKSEDVLGLNEHHNYTTEPVCDETEISRKCVDCNLAEVTRQLENCTKETEIVADRSCKEDCYETLDSNRNNEAAVADVASPTKTYPDATDSGNGISKEDLDQIRHRLEQNLNESEKDNHKECKDGICAVVSGSGSDECSFGTDECWHYECKDGNCVSVNGRGADQCHISFDCVHNECHGGECVKVNGSGTDQCTFSDDCKHTECRDGKCVEVNGAGEDDQCYIDSNCYHYECRDKECVKVNGGGEEDQCIMDWDCEEH